MTMLHPVKLAVLDDWEHQWQHSGRVAALRECFDVTIFDRPLDRASAARSLADTEVLILNRERTPVDEAFLDAVPALRTICNTGTGIAHVDRAAVERRGITILTAPGGSTISVAEHAIALILTILREIPRLDADVRAGGFERPIVADFADQTLGIAGTGAIGMQVLHVARAFGPRIVAWSRSLTDQRARELGIERAPTLIDLARTCSVLTLHLRVTPETRGLVDAEVLAAMPPGAVLINTSRAALIDRTALMERLKRGDLRVGLDVFDEEPPPPDDPIRQAPGVLTPHEAWMTPATWDRFIAVAIDVVLSAYGKAQPA